MRWWWLGRRAETVDGYGQKEKGALDDDSKRPRVEGSGGDYSELYSVRHIEVLCTVKYSNPAIYSVWSRELRIFTMSMCYA